MRILLIYPEFPTTYWGFQHSLALVGKRATIPPLGLISVAALLPQEWDYRLIDMNVESLDDEDMRWADVVLTGGMLVQEESTHDVIARAHRLERRVVVGGPACTTSPERFADADCLFLGEAEGRVPLLLAAIEGKADIPRILDAPGDRPSLADTPIPRFDLLDITEYSSLSIQTSRGCPFSCEFCDIIEIFGRVPRVKEPARVLAELDALHALGYRGEVFIVDDNFIGNKKASRVLLRELADWGRGQAYPFTFYTEASLNLARDEKLIALMREAGFTSVFIGIETTDPEALKLTQKKQNVGVDVPEALTKLTKAGIEVMAGFIVGFDGDTPRSFETQRELLRDAPLPLAMTGLLIALPSTALWRRLEREGRLRDHSDGDAFGRPNFQPTMPERELIEGYASLLEELYAPAPYFRRCEALVDLIGAPAHRMPLPLDDVWVALRAVFHLGILSPRRGFFWRLLRRALPRGRHAVTTAIACAVRGEHMIRYTVEAVLPRLRAAVDALGTERPLPVKVRRTLPVVTAFAE